MQSSVSERVDNPQAQRPSWAWIVLILLVGLFLRAYELDRVPPGLDGDEMFNGWDALRVWDGNLEVYFPANYGREPVLIYLIALTTRVLGMGTWTIRLPSVVGGMAGLVFSWVLARRLFNFRIAVLTTALMAVSLWPVLLSHVALRAGLLPACQAATVYALWRTLVDAGSARPGSRGWAVVAGLFAGLSLYTYTSSRIFPLVWILWLLVLAILRDPNHQLRLTRRSLCSLILMGVVAGLVVLPLGIFALRHPDTFNQRVSSLDSELNQIRVGNLEPARDSVKATLGMFTLSGDKEWRYNPAGRPIFDWGTGALFTLGLAVALSRLRQPAYSLLLIWLPVMLAPTVFSIGTPSFLRAVGAMTPTYLLPAVGVDFIVERIAQRVTRNAQHAIHIVLLVGLILVGADTWHDTFDEWVRQPQVLHTYEADLAAAARYLDRQAPAGTPVWVSSDYPGDLSRMVLALQSAYSGPVRWFNGNQVTVWPSGWAGRDVLLIFTKSSPPNPDALAVLGDYLIFQENDAAGEPHLWVYQIPGDALSGTPWQPAHALSGRFAYDREVLGYDAPARVQRQASVPVVVYWRVPPGVEYDANDLPHSFVCVQDRSVGRCLDQVPPHYNAYPVWDWTVGDVVAQRYTVPVPAYLLPQTTYFHVGMFTSAGEIGLADEKRAGVPLLVGPVEVVGSASVDPKWDADTPVFRQDLALVGFHMPTALSPGSTWEAELEWQALRPPDSDYVVRLELRDDATGNVVTSVEELVGSPHHPTSRWVSGEPVHTFHRMRIPPALDEGQLDVYLVLLEDAAGQMIADPLVLGALSVSGRPHHFDLPTPEYPLVADFGSSIRLLGYDLKQVHPTGGGQIEIVLYWQALDVVDQDYKVFVHLYHPTIPGGLPGQHDSVPGNGAFPTLSWLSGEVVTDPHLVPIEPNADPGVSKLGVGLYLPATGGRLPVAVDGQYQPDDVLILTQIEIQ
jgi:hypothetical protein